jgi:hypothetical protein
MAISSGRLQEGLDRPSHWIRALLHVSQTFSEAIAGSSRAGAACSASRLIQEMQRRPFILLDRDLDGALRGFEVLASTSFSFEGT